MEKDVFECRFLAFLIIFNHCYHRRKMPMFFNA